MAERQKSAKSALIIIDWQNFFVDRSSKAYVKGSLKLHSKLRRAAEHFLRGNNPVFASRHFSEEKPKDPFYRFYSRVLKKDDRLFQLGKPLASMTGVKAYDKKTYSLFENEEFLEELRRSGIKRTFLSGLLADKCVLANSFAAFDKGFEVTVIEDCVISRNSEDNLWALSVIGRCCGKLLRSDQLDGAGI